MKKYCVKTRIKEEFPDLKISESIMLHQLYDSEVSNPQGYIEEVVNYMNTMDFASISFYPFAQGMDSEQDFQEAFDFLHEKMEVPIAFVETGHLSEDLHVEAFDSLFIPGNECEQNEYLETLLTNAQNQAYNYVIWWGHRDYDELLEVFPTELKDIGTFWISNGIINEDGREKKAYSTWKRAFSR